MSAAKTIKAGRFVNNKHVTMLRENYKQKRWEANSARLGKPDSLSVWYSLDGLKEYIETAEAAGADGIRVYFGVYPSVFPENILLQDRQTVVFVATQQKTSQTGKTESKDLYVSTPDGPEIIAFNFSLPCPPACTGPERTAQRTVELRPAGN
ncbi:hypothetical protein [Chitinophaga ginsengisoli]|uniref:Uncharacterized protein n=1 Tax=Chitinophaga ginsengisoli TaxID=363837 RepID=A0A2P8FUT7_9BACT|nr:hypothetical protein [Chitinophaga ginsengisoli]PSL25477.1 hypothetical protein CLV42_113159 [Chitinophaga ginsengisoli]